MGPCLWLHTVARQNQSERLIMQSVVEQIKIQHPNNVTRIFSKKTVILITNLTPNTKYTISARPTATRDEKAISNVMFSDELQVKTSKQL